MLELAVLLIAGAIALLVLGLLWRQENPVERRLVALQGGEARMPIEFQQPRQVSFTARVLVPLAESLGRQLAAILPSNILAAADKQLTQAGQPLTLVGFLGIVGIVEALLTSIAALLAFSSDGNLTTLAAAPAMVLLGFMAPRVWLSNRVRHRQKVILKSLPDAFDLITTCVEAGLGLDAALAKVAEKVEGPFAEELLITLKEVSLGKLRRDALKEMGERTGVPDLAMFINAVIQAETMGTSIAAVLRVQADQMRTRRRQRAEQQAYQAPVKMIFPLALCIFPTLFIVILGPAAITIYENLIGG